MASRGQSRCWIELTESPPPPSYPCYPPYPIGHLEGTLAGRHRVTWWRVSPISMVGPPAPFRESRHTGHHFLLGGCRGASLLPEAPRSPLVSLSFPPPLPPLANPLVTPGPLVVALVTPPPPPCHPLCPPSLSSITSRRCCSASSRVAKRMEEGTRKVPPSFLFPLPLPLLPTSPIGPLGQHPPFVGPKVGIPVRQHRHLADGSPFLPRDVPGVPHTQRVPSGVATPTRKGGGAGFALVLGWGLGLGAFLALGWGSFSPSLSFSKNFSRLLLGAPKGALVCPWQGGGGLPTTTDVAAAAVVAAAPLAAVVAVAVAAVPLFRHPRPPCTLHVQPHECLFASQRPNPINTKSATLGSCPNMRPSSVTLTRLVRPPPSPHSTRTLRGSPA